MLALFVFLAWGSAPHPGSHHPTAHSPRRGDPGVARGGPSAPLRSLAVTAAVSAPADVAGNWRVEFVVPNGEMAVNMTLNQNGTKLSGRVVNEDGEFPLDGSIDGDQVTVTWVVPERGAQMPITMKGTVDGEYITGTARLGDVGEGSLSARRVSRNP